MTEHRSGAGPPRPLKAGTADLTPIYTSCADGRIALLQLPYPLDGRRIRRCGGRGFPAPVQELNSKEAYFALASSLSLLS